MRGFGWGGEEDEEEEEKAGGRVLMRKERERERVMKKGKREIEQGACWKDSKVRSRRLCRPRDMF